MYRKATAGAVLVLILAFTLSACRSGGSKESPSDALNHAKSCVSPDPSVSYLPAPRSDLKDCLTKAMRDPAARRFLLDTGNAAIQAWSAAMVRFIVDDVAADPEKRVHRILGRLGEADAVAAPARRVGEFYRQLVIAEFTAVKSQRDAAAEVAGVLKSFVSQGPDKPADAFISNVRSRLPDPKNSDLKVEVLDIVADRAEELVALSLWANDQVRAELLAGDPPDPPATPPPATSPPLEDPPGRLRIPSTDEQPAHDMFYNWYEHQGGLPLKAAARGAVRVSGLSKALFGEAP